MVKVSFSKSYENIPDDVLIVENHDISNKLRHYTININNILIVGKNLQMKIVDKIRIISTTTLQMVQKYIEYEKPRTNYKNEMAA